MKLKKVEIQGFKSFADKIEILFKKGITAIVGPNGSGKSNISDAIRWVLGEQSIKTLRGSKMEDIIFAGTGTRKALGYTEVTITFDNTSGNIPLEYDEIAVTRRMFRSGESEYYLNKNSCRLRDIRELFMDTGIGKDGYSIVGQGRIDEILSNRPEDRRSIFEEAAGIVKYKSKKEESEKNLKKTEENILRINDLVFELSSQAEVLEEQACKANQHSKLFNELKDLEVNIFLKDIKEDTNQTKNINRKILELETNLKIKLINKKSIEEKFNLLKENTEKIDISIEEYRNEEMEKINEIEKNRNKITLLEEKKRYNIKDLKRIENEKEESRRKLEKLIKTSNQNKEYIDKYKDEYNKILSTYNSNVGKLEKRSKELEEVEKNIEIKKDNIMKTYNKSSDKRSELNSISSFNENIEKRIIQLNKEITEMKKDKESTKQEYKLVSKTEKGLIDDLSDEKNKFENIEKIEKQKIKNKNLINENINLNNIELQRKISSLNLFKNMERSYEGYYRGVKSVLKAAEKNPNIEKGLVGVVAELIKVDEKFETAIDTALGSRAQNIVTKSEEAAKTTIEYLKNNKLGRITCLPLNIIKGNTLRFSDEDRNKFKILGLGSEVIDYENKHDNLFKYLLGRTVIIENMNYGIKLANKYNHSHRIVTLSGEVLNPGGSMTGGSHSSSSVSIINRKNRIEKLELEINEHKKTQNKLQKEKEEIENKLYEVKEKVEKYRNSIRNLEYETINTTNNKENHRLELLRLDKSIKKSSNEIETLNFEVDNYNIKKSELRNSTKKLEGKSKSIKENIKKLTTTFDEGKTYKNEIDKVVTDMKINLNNKKSQIQNLKEGLENNNSDISNTEIGIKEKKISILSNEKEINSIKESSKELINDIKNLDNIKDGIKMNLNNSIEKKKQIMDSFYLEQENLKSINEEISKMDKLKNSKEVKLARISVQLETYHKKLQDDYELTYKEALKYEKQLENIKESIIKSRKLKTEIKKLGTVNLSSIKEYKKIKTRLDFILDQQNDLTTAKEDLENVILDIEGTMKKQFLESFDQINKNFQEIFKILFDGGKSELYLENNEEVLSTGIKIKAQPPGKKLQNLSLLSGGEKSLTAVALLFSILKMKPAPFCVLDEIDAALDESNIGRYTNYLKTYCSDTQFIIITHRKATMEMADVLYGVTMEEKGISKLISVELTDDMDGIAS